MRSVLGTFVCNDLMYGLLFALQNAGVEIPAGFIHVPCLPGQTGDDGPSLPPAEIAAGLQAALAVLTELP